MQNQLLLLDDVENVGRSGDVVSVRPGYARNFLLPQKKAVVADKFTLRLQARLKEERAKQAETDKAEALVVSERISNMEVSMVAKVDPDGNMYGSVTVSDIVKVLEKENIILDRKNIVLAHPIREIGVHRIQLKLKEGVPAQFVLKIESDRPLPRREVKPVLEEIQQSDDQ